MKCGQIFRNQRLLIFRKNLYCLEVIWFLRLPLSFCLRQKARSNFCIDTIEIDYCDNIISIWRKFLRTVGECIASRLGFINKSIFKGRWHSSSPACLSGIERRSGMSGQNCLFYECLFCKLSILSVETISNAIFDCHLYPVNCFLLKFVFNMKYDVRPSTYFINSITRRILKMLLALCFSQ